MVVLREAVVEISGGPAEGDGAGEHGPEREHQDDGERPVLVAAAAEGGGIRRAGVLPRRRRRREGHRRGRSGRGHGKHVIVSHNCSGECGKESEVEDSRSNSCSIDLNHGENREIGFSFKKKKEKRKGKLPCRRGLCLCK